MKKLFTLFSVCFLFAIGLLQQNTVLAQVVINEYSCSNFDSFTDDYQEYGDWIELYNKGNGPVNIGGYYLSDNPDAPTKWQFPSQTVLQVGGFIRVWASGRNVTSLNHFHTNFKLTQTKSTGETVVLANTSGTIIDQVQFTITQKGHSNGRKTDGGVTWGVFTFPTPGSSNNTPVYTRYAAKPQMSIQGGFYPAGITVSISTTEPNSKICYTINGTEPLPSSTQYTAPILVGNTKVLKAKVFSNDTDILPSLIDFNTYFINENFTTAVVSISATDLTALLNGNGNIKPWGSIEYFDKNKVRTTKGYGEFDKHGQDSWVHPQRSLDYKMRDECGYNYALLEKFFSDTERDEFQKIILRACGDDNYPGIDSSALIRDDFVQTVAVKAGMSLDERKSARCVVFANGQYWGVYSIREKPNDHDFTKYYYDQDKFNLYYLMLWGNTWAEYGGQDAINDWETLYTYIMTHNLSNPAYYSYVQERFDPASLTDYMLTNSYVVCSDWLNWNVGWWKGLNPNGGHKRWGYQLWDEDATFGHYINYTHIPAQSPYVTPCFQESITGGNDPEGHVKVLNKLLQNPDFKQYYISRYADLLNTAFKPTNMISILDSMVNIIQPEMPRHCIRWGGIMEDWTENVQKIRNFINTRYNVVSAGINGCYGVTGPYSLTVAVDPPEAGQVMLNSLTLESSPWAGNYYGNMDTKATAIETNQQFKFDHWEVNHATLLPNELERNINFQLLSNDTLTAVFIPRVFTDSLVINEINYNSSPAFDPGDWVELYNPHDYALNISDWVFKDEDDLHSYKFAQGTTIPAKGYIVIAFDMTLFHNMFPTVTNYVGPMGFGFAGGGELLRLYNNTGTLIDTVNYDDVAPWPTEPDGQGATLELKSPVLDNALASSWIASVNPPHGTPGAENSFFVGGNKPSKVENVVLSVNPNPVKNMASIQIHTNEIIDNGLIEVFSITGQKIRQIQSVNTKQIEISRDGLNSGCYIIRFTNGNNNLLGVAKMLVE